MMDQDQSLPTSGEGATEHGAGGRGKPEHYHARQLELFQESLARDGEAALQRWGLAMFHSLPDTDAQSQRKQLGLTMRDGLDAYNEACRLAAEGDFAAAVKEFRKALDLQGGTFAEALFNLALALEQAGDRAGAREAWQRYIEQHGDSEDIADVRQHLGTLAD